MTVVTVLCLVYMTLLLCALIGAYFAGADDGRLKIRSRSEKLRFLKSFKKGKFALIYLAAFPLYYLGIRHSGESVIESLMDAMKNCVEVVVLKYNYGDVKALAEVNSLYKAVVFTCYALVTLNAFTFVFTVLREKIYNARRAFSVTKLAKKSYVVVGDSAANRAIIRSMGKKKNAIMLVDSVNESVRDFAFVEKIAVAGLKGKPVGSALKRLFGGFTNKRVSVIVNLGDDSRNLTECDSIASLIADCGLGRLATSENGGVDAYVFGEPENESTFLYYEKTTGGCVHYVNKYRLIAMDFCGKHPLTEFMTGKQLDTATGLITPETEINVVMLGFGKTGRKLFLTMAENNRFMTRGENGIAVPKTVNYFVYDKSETNNDKTLNHGLLRYDRVYVDMLSRKAEYLPVPEPIARRSFFCLDVGDNDFYVSLKSNLDNGGDNAYNYVIVSCGTDLQNLDLAEKLTEKLSEWGKRGNTKIFVKIRSGSLTGKVVDKNYARRGGYYTFGSESETVYSLSRITSEENERMAKDRHFCYTYENAADGKTEEEVRRAANEKWYVGWQQVQRESNVYACLAIRMKLQLLGFDLSRDPGTPDASREFMKKYADGDEIKYTGREVMGKKIVDYGDCNFVHGSVRDNFARQEHERWNAYMISSGYVPATIEEIRTLEKSEMLARRKHANITTFEGLIDYRKIMSEKNGMSEADNDVIKYDYQIMDDLPWLLGRGGYKIVKKSDRK